MFATAYPHALIQGMMSDSSACMVTSSLPLTCTQTNHVGSHHFPFGGILIVMLRFYFCIHTVTAHLMFNVLQFH